MLYIWMPEANGDWHWSTGEGWQAAENIEQLAQAIQASAQQDAVVFFPSASTQVLSQAMPKAQYKKLGQDGVKYLLEEYVILPVDHLKVMHHFHADQLYMLGISQAQVETYQHALNLLPIQLIALLPDFLLVPHVADKTVVAQIAGRTLLRENEWLGRASDDLNTYMQLQEQQHSYLLLDISDAGLQQAHADIEMGMYRFVPLKKPQQHPFNILPKSKSAQQLFSGYSKACAVVFAGVLLVQFSYDALRWVQNKKMADLTAQQAITQYQSWFGANARLSEQNLKSQFESQLRLSQAADTQALSLLSRVGPLLMQQQIVAKTVNYEAQQLSLQLSANSADVIRQLSQQLTQQGFKVELGNIQASAHGGAIGQVKIQ